MVIFFLLNYTTMGNKIVDTVLVKHRITFENKTIHTPSLHSKFLHGQLEQWYNITSKGWGMESSPVAFEVGKTSEKPFKKVFQLILLRLQLHLFIIVWFQSSEALTIGDKDQINVFSSEDDELLNDRDKQSTSPDTTVTETAEEIKVFC